MLGPFEVTDIKEKLVTLKRGRSQTRANIEQLEHFIESEEGIPKKVKRMISSLLDQCSAPAVRKIPTQGNSQATDFCSIFVPHKMLPIFSYPQHF